MSLREGDFYDLERTIFERTVRSLNTADVQLWNSTIELEQRRGDYLERLETEILSMCEYLGS
jgi:hypothetical protein